jgi:hypothetical protein
MSKSVFISYCHVQGAWVLDRLLPCLQAGGTDVRIDRDRYEAGKVVLGQMDATQDEAESSVLVLSPEYLVSPYCLHEMRRAIARDPQFHHGTIVPLQRVACPLPAVAETRFLLTEPLKYSSLWPAVAAGRPQFAPEFWGDNGIEHIHAEAGGWPHLVQLIAETVVDLINDTATDRVDDSILERALEAAIVRGHNVLYELVRRESGLPGEWEYLSAFRSHDTQPPPVDEAVYASLWRRQLVEDDGRAWRLRVPLMMRWLRRRG